MAILETIEFTGGSVTIPRTAESLSESASEWMALAAIHFAEAEAQREAGDLDKAIEQTCFAETKLATARMRLIEARELEAMVRGS
jgi:hypothetical protein